MLQVDIDELRRLATTVTSVGAEIDKIDVRTNLNRAFSQTEIPAGQYLQSHVNELAMLDGRISNAAANALTFQDLNAVQEYNNVEQGVYDSKKAI